MKIIYDQKTDTMTVILKESIIEESDEAKSGIIIDYDNQGDIVSIEILDAKKANHSTNPSYLPACGKGCRGKVIAIHQRFSSYD